MLRRRMMMMQSGEKIILPDEYQMLEYIEAKSDCKQYINTGIYVDGVYNLYADIECLFTLMGARYDVYPYYVRYGDIRVIGLQIQQNNNSLFVANNNGVRNFTESFFDKKMHYSVKATNENTMVAKAFSETVVIEQTPQKCTHPIYLMKAVINGNLQGTSWFCGCRYYYFGFEDKKYNKLFIPCYVKSSNITGMYDYRNDVFHPNAGSGTFTRGREIDFMYVKR